CIYGARYIRVKGGNETAGLHPRLHRPFFYLWTAFLRRREKAYRV
ncbi:MAG: hypothetical protein K0R53_830, partial [Burkholderiales bacterium]|nr:hypothetical protein [Burkholderiales bacterium]